MGIITNTDTGTRTKHGNLYFWRNTRQTWHFDLWIKYELRRNLPADEKERDAYVLGIVTVLYEMFEKNEASRIVDAVTHDELVDYILW